MAMVLAGRARAATDIAEFITPDIQALADGLQHDPVQIYNYVHDHIRYVCYCGSKKGAELTYLEKSGNDFDQCALLVSLLRAAGYTNAGSQFGWMLMPYDNPDGSHRDVKHWLGLTLTTNDWSATIANVHSFLIQRGYPLTAWSLNYRPFNVIGLQRVWVTLPIGGVTNYLDPAFKVSEPTSGINLAVAMGKTDSVTLSNVLMSAAGGVTTADYVTNLDEISLDSKLLECTTNLLSYLQSNYPNASMAQIPGGQIIVPSTNTALSQSLFFTITNINGTMPVLNWINQPTNLMSALTITFGNSSKTYKWLTPQLKGQRISMVYGGSSVQLWQDDTNLSTGSFSGQDSVFLSAYYPMSSINVTAWDTTNNVLAAGAGFTQTSAATPYNANSSYAILYAYQPDWGWF